MSLTEGTNSKTKKKNVSWTLTITNFLLDELEEFIKSHGNIKDKETAKLKKQVAEKINTNYKPLVQFDEESVANKMGTLSRNHSEYKKKLDQTGVGKVVPEHDPKLTTWRVDSKTFEKLEAIWGGVNGYGEHATSVGIS